MTKSRILPLKLEYGFASDRHQPEARLHELSRVPTGRTPGSRVVLTRYKNYPQSRFGAWEGDRIIAGVSGIAHLKNIFRPKKFFLDTPKSQNTTFLPARAFFTLISPRLMSTARNSRYPQKILETWRFRRVSPERRRISPIADYKLSIAT